MSKFKLPVVAAAVFAASLGAVAEVESLAVEAELGLVSTTGNTEAETINAKLKLAKGIENWKHEANFAVLSNSQEDQDTGEDETTAEKYSLSMKSDRA